MPLLFREMRCMRMCRTLLRKLLPFCLSLLLCLQCSPSASAAFSDVPPDHWASPEIQKISELGLIQGDQQGAFRPNDSVSIQAFLSMLCRATGLDDRALESGSHWAEPAVAYAGYLNWYDTDEIKPETLSQPITREMAAKLLVNALFADHLKLRSPVSFRDKTSIQSACLPHVMVAVRLKLIGGYPDGTFRPQGNLTRAAAAALLCRALELDHSAKTGSAEASVQIPILMYHDISYLGEGYSKTPEIFRAQMTELKDAGFTTVFYADLIDYVENGSPLPEKPIIISVDDGYQSNHTYLFPILQDLHMKAEISLIGRAISRYDWAMTWSQIREMADSGLVSFQSHTNNLHNDLTAQGGRLGVLKHSDESWAAYVTLLGDDIAESMKLLESKVGVLPNTFTYPRGKWNHMAEGLTLQAGCKASVTTLDGIASVRQGDPSSLRLMNRIGMDHRNGSVLKVLEQFGYQT